jgi:hypothetical protein
VARNGRTLAVRASLIVKRGENGTHGRGESRQAARGESLNPEEHALYEAVSTWRRTKNWEKKGPTRPIACHPCHPDQWDAFWGNVAADMAA